MWTQSFVVKLRSFRVAVSLDSALCSRKASYVKYNESVYTDRHQP